jgi:hypothetical protein
MARAYSLDLRERVVAFVAGRPICCERPEMAELALERFIS